MSRNLEGLAGSNNKLSSGQKYTRVSQNTSQTARALAVREQLYRNEQYATTVGNAESELTVAEGNLQMVNNVMRNLEDRLLQASNGTVSSNERELIARELEGLQDQIMQISNAQFDRKYLFAGSGNGSAPFTETDGKLYYNGYAVDDIVIDPATGKHAIPDATDPTILVPLDYNKEVYVDIGMGLTMTGSGASTNLDQRTAIKVSTTGLEAFGFGINSETGAPNNIWSLLGRAISDLKNDNHEGIKQDIAQISNTYDQLLSTLTDIGARSAYLEDSLNRLDSESINLKESQQSLEAVALDEESIYNKTAEMSWMVTLQLGSKIIPPSIFDFIK